jgi:hypothetical protein
MPLDVLELAFGDAASLNEVYLLQLGTGKNVPI